MSNFSYYYLIYWAFPEKFLDILKVEIIIYLNGVEQPIHQIRVSKKFWLFPLAPSNSSLFIKPLNGEGYRKARHKISNKKRQFFSALAIKRQLIFIVFPTVFFYINQKKQQFERKVFSFSFPIVSWIEMKNFKINFFQLFSHFSLIFSWKIRVKKFVK